MRFLYKCRIEVYKDSFNLNCKPLNAEGQKSKTIVFRGSEEGFRSFLRKVKAKDTETTPASVKNRTYQQMIDQAKQKIDPYVFIWSNMLPQEGVVKESFLSTNKTAKEWLEENKGDLDVT